jgi:hypothetical protein
MLGRINAPDMAAKNTSAHSAGRHPKASRAGLGSRPEALRGHTHKKSCPKVKEKRYFSGVIGEPHLDPE